MTDKHTGKRTETHACDLIDRQAAIDAVYKCTDIFVGNMPIMVDKADAYEALAQLPSAQPETPPYVSEIESEYKKWVNIPYINKPLAKALYEVWKKHDREDVSRNG